MNIPDEERRVALRRTILDFKEEIHALAGEIEPFASDAAESLRAARSSLFEAWTILCGPPEDDDDH
jgi:hypothetical protein